MLAIFGCCLAVVLNRPIYERSAIASVTLLVVVVILIFPIGGLFGFHLVLISNGRTTNEHVTGKYRGNNFFTRGLCKNFLFLFCGSLTPQLRAVKLKKKKLSKLITNHETNNNNNNHNITNNDDNNNIVLDENSIELSPTNSKKMNHNANSDESDDDDDDDFDDNNNNNDNGAELADVVKPLKYNRKPSISSTDSISSASMLKANEAKT